ncbi:MAG: GUN4 domain-containing protein [Cyanobacteria bacterium J06621_8]
MKQRLVYLFKLLALVSLTAYLSSSGELKAENNSKALEITDKDGKSTIFYESSHALVIWVGDYQHWGRLNNVETEAKQVVNTLKERGFNVTTVGNPTGESLRSSIKDFIDNYGYEPDNRLVIFFTGHGHTRNRTKGYLVPVDAPDPIIDERSFLKYAFSMDRMMLWAREIEAKHALFVFDSCFSGTVFKTKANPRLDNAYIRDVTAKPVRQFIAAGDADQEVPAKSIFTPLFIRGLEGEADYTKDGYVTGSELGLYLTQTLREYTSDQTPQYGKIRDVELDRGDIVFRSLTKPTVTPSDETSSLLQENSQTILISKSTGVYYSPLRNLLVARKWKEADEETANAMLQAAGKVNEGWLSPEDIGNFSCEDLGIINKLWLESSQGKFGFSVQKDIYEELGGTSEYDSKVWSNFQDRVGWRKRGNWVNYEEFTFNLNAPQAHLPYVTLWQYNPQKRPSYIQPIFFFARAANCNL